MVLLFIETEDLGLAMILCDGSDAAAASLQKDGRVEQRGLFAAQCIDKDVERIVAQVLWVTRFVDVPDVGHANEGVGDTII